MIEDIMAEMGHLFRKGVFSKRTTFVFVVDGATITVAVEADSFTVEQGTPGGKADCTCKTSAEIFKKIWYDGYKPGIMDFMSGAIKADAPLLLPLFLKAFGKER